MADDLAKVDTKSKYHFPMEYEHAHSTSYFLHIDKWIGMYPILYKSPIRHFQNIFNQIFKSYLLK
jgi:hypothetical protein